MHILSLKHNLCRFLASFSCNLSRPTWLICTWLHFMTFWSAKIASLFFLVVKINRHGHIILLEAVNFFIGHIHNRFFQISLRHPNSAHECLIKIRQLEAILWRRCGSLDFLLLSGLFLHQSLSTTTTWHLVLFSK